MKQDSQGKSRREFLKAAGLTGLGISFHSSAAQIFDQPSGALNIASAKSVNLSRQKIPLEANWRFQKPDPEAANELAPAQFEFDDQSWESGGVPHSYNDLDSFQNAPDSRTFQGQAWYRTRFTVDKTAEGKKVFLEFQGVNIGAAVYVNGKFKPGNTAVAQPQPTTHVGGFLPFVLDVTDDVKIGADNILAVRVGNGGDRRSGQSFFKDPGFGTYIGFGMGFGGIHSPVSLHVTPRIHVPFDSYSPLQKWGTYTGTVSASDDAAQIRLQTNVENADAAPRNATLSVRVLDEKDAIVLTLNDSTQTIKPGGIALFDQIATLKNPHLWYPNNSPFGKPYLYKIIREVRLENTVVDRVESPLGIRMITWDDDYCYVNGKKHLLNGFGQRNIYPALASAVPQEIQWNDVRLIAECGGNLLRVGHVPPFLETVQACDAYGVLLLMDSGDNEWALHGEPAVTYKKEYDRDMIIRYRSHPSVLAWESNNGLAKPPAVPYSIKSTIDLADQWDYIQPRIVGSRDKSDCFPTDRKIMIGYTNRYEKVKGSPSMNWEVYFGNFKKDEAGKQLTSFTGARFDYANEKAIADHTVTDYLKNMGNQACGWVAWMLAETQGEAYLTYLNGMSHQKSLGSCAMDGNRFPKLTYQIYKNALWIPFSIRPGVTLQSHWNLSGVQTVDAWSNCPSVELFLNETSLGLRQPDEKKRCIWNDVTWQSGALKAVGRDASGKEVCSDLRQTAGAPHRIALVAEPRLTKPSGEKFQLTANGSAAAIITATIVDENGNWCPLADNNIRFKVTGPGSYRGSYNFYVTPNQPLTYHAPGDSELQAEGGLMRVAIRSTFQSGTVQVTAESAGLLPGTTSFQTVGRI